MRRSACCVRSLPTRHRRSSARSSCSDLGPPARCRPISRPSSRLAGRADARHGTACRRASIRLDPPRSTSSACSRSRWSRRGPGGRRAARRGLVRARRACGRRARADRAPPSDADAAALADLEPELAATGRARGSRCRCDRRRDARAWRPTPSRADGTTQAEAPGGRHNSRGAARAAAPAGACARALPNLLMVRQPNPTRIRSMPIDDDDVFDDDDDGLGAHGFHVVEDEAEDPVELVEGRARGARRTCDDRRRTCAIARPTRFASTCARSAAFRCSRPRKRSRSRSASSAATRPLGAT